MAENNPTTSALETNLFQHLRSFIHLTTQAPLEHVCTSSLYLLTRVPSTRHAVIEYIGTVYKVATFLHLRFNLNQKNPNYPDINADTKNINHINQVIDSIETALIELLEKSENNEFWSLELSQWLVELIGDIVQNTGITFSDTPGLTSEESLNFKLPSIVDGLEIWNNQCIPTQSILYLIQKCFVCVTQSTQLTLIDLILNASTKYSNRYDWILCYLSPFKTNLFFEKMLLAGSKECQSQTKKDKFSRVNAINFYALNYSSIVRDELIKFLNNSLNERKLFISRLASQTPGLLILLANEILDKYNFNNVIQKELKSALISNEKSIVPEIFNCIKQLNNSIAVFDMITSVLDMLFNQDENLKKIQDIIVIFIF